LNAVGIIGYGHYLPVGILTNQELAVRFGKTETWIEERTGIRERRVADVHTATSDMAANAAVYALKTAKLAPIDIDLIIVATTTPDMVFPSTACLVQQKIGAAKAAAFDISAACTGFVYGLDIATKYVLSGQYRNVLLIGADKYSHITNPDDLNTSILFGDGAGAVLIGQVPSGYGALGTILGSDGTRSDLLKVPAGGSRLPLTTDLLISKSNTISMNGREVFQFAVKTFEKLINQIVAQAGLMVGDIALIVPHQANKRILNSVSERLNLEPDKMFCNIEKYGNMSAASIPVALAEACNNGRIKKNDIILLIGFGAGLTWGACLLRWYEKSQAISGRRED
jgi:3-oxoacyl-[acyl-carrier-protein] synthase-3